MNDVFELVHEWAESQEPVFIVGPERSGTSMMFRTIVSHPAFCSFNNATVETFCFIHPYRLLEKASSDNYEQRVYLGKQYAAFMEAITEIKRVNEECDAAGLSQSYLSEQREVIWERRGFRDLLRAFFYFSWLNLGRMRIAEKTPAHVRCMEEIIECFPKAKILICLRNPVETIASHRKRLAKEIELGKDPKDPGLEWLTKSVAHYLGYFEHVANMVGVAQRSFPKSVKIVPYSKVTSNADFLREVFAFLEEDPLLLSSESRMTSDKTLDWDPLLASLPKENVIDWRAWMTEEEAELVQRNDLISGWNRF